METHNEYFEANRQLWNKRTAIHKGSEFYDVAGFIEGRNMLTPIELTEVSDVAGKTLLHLQCHFGMDTLCWARLGAKVTGVDISDEAINEAKKLAANTGIDARFVCCNVYNTREFVKDTFDIVFTSYGTIGWLPDLEKWAQVVADSLKNGGMFYMADFHPVLWMFDDDFKRLKYPYYNKEVIVTESQGTYADKSAAIESKEYGWNHSISEILNALLRKGLKLEYFNEHYYSPYNCFSKTVEITPGQWQIKGLEGIIPMVYSLKVVK